MLKIKKNYSCITSCELLKLSKLLGGGGGAKQYICPPIFSLEGGCPPPPPPPDHASVYLNKTINTKWYWDFFFFVVVNTTYQSSNIHNCSFLSIWGNNGISVRVKVCGYTMYSFLRELWWPTHAQRFAKFVLIVFRTYRFQNKRGKNTKRALRVAVVWAYCVIMIVNKIHDVTICDASSQTKALILGVKKTQHILHFGLWITR